MSLTKEEKASIIKEFALGPLDTGSPEVQCALWTYDISKLTVANQENNKVHFQENTKDFQSLKGFHAMTHKRKRLLQYLKKISVERYKTLVEKLKLRKS